MNESNAQSPRGAIRHRCNQAELQFRRGVVRVCQSILVLMAAYLGIGLLVGRSSVLAESESRHTYIKTRIVVRQLWSAPLWAWPVARIIEDSPQHRFEFYRGSKLWSCQSHTGDSYRSNSAQIEWDSEGTATVLLDHSPLFTCSNGEWNQFKRR